MTNVTINFTPIILTIMLIFVFCSFIIFMFFKYQDKEQVRKHETDKNIEDNRTDIVMTSLNNLKNPTENDKIFRMLLTLHATNIEVLQDQVEVLKTKIKLMSEE